MNKRHSVRYDSDLLPKRLDKVSVSLMGNSSIESHVVNYCALGIRISIPPAEFPIDCPKKNETIKVLLPIDSLWLTGMCVYAAKEPDGSVSMGIYFYNPSEQNRLYNLLINSLNVPTLTSSFVSREWEELVEKLCASDDPRLQKIGLYEMGIILSQQKGLPPPIAPIRSEIRG